MSWTKTRSEIAHTLKKNPQADVTELRRKLRAERTAEFIKKQLAVWPPLTDQQRTQLAELLKPVQITPADIPGGA